MCQWDRVIFNFFNNEIHRWFHKINLFRIILLSTKKHFYEYFPIFHKPGPKYIEKILRWIYLIFFFIKILCYGVNLISQTISLNYLKIFENSFLKKFTEKVLMYFVPGPFQGFFQACIPNTEIFKFLKNKIYWSHHEN